MTFDPRSLFPRWKATRDFATVDELVAAVRKQLEIEEAGPDDAEAMHGQLAGALISGPATLARDPTLGSPRFQAGFLSGHLQAYLIRTVGPLRSEWILPTTVYAASLLTRGGAPPRGRSEPNIVAVHTYASLRAAERGDLPLDVELGAFRWLAARYSIAVTARLVEQLEVARIRRLELQVALESEQALDPPAAAAARNARRLRQCINSVERQIVVTDPGLPEIDRLRGALAGLLAVSGTGPVPAASDDTTSESYRGGRFGGELLASLIQGDMMPSETLRSICYRYGAALATPSGGTLLAEAPPTNALKAHTLGIHVLQQGVAAAPLDEELELALLTWLAARLEVPLTPDLVEHRKRFVARPKTPG